MKSKILKKKEYFNISGNLDYKGNNIEIKYEKKINKLEDIYKIFELTKTKDFIITKIEKKEKKEKAKAPFITSSLQQEAHNKLGMNSKKTMLIAQRLYEGGLITYMRTDSINISKDALKYNMHKSIVFFPLVLTYFTGPVGLCFYLILRLLVVQKFKLHE